MCFGIGMSAFCPNKKEEEGSIVCGFCLIPSQRRKEVFYKSRI
jgi:hypothetical protein